MTKKLRKETVKLEKLVVGGQAIGTLTDGKKIFVWGGLPGEAVSVRVTKQKSKWAEGIVGTVLQPSHERVVPHDADSYLSTSPWQILAESEEDNLKQSLVVESFRQHHVTLPEGATYHPTSKWYGYRNKVEFSFYFDTEKDLLELCFFQRGGHGKLPVDGTSLAMPQINEAARNIRDLLRQNRIEGRALKTILIRAQQDGTAVAQLYGKDKSKQLLSHDQMKSLGLKGMQIIYSNPLSPASVVTEVLDSYGETRLSDTLLNTEFTYACEGFFQVNLPVYEQALRDMAQFIDTSRPTVDLYSGVGTIGLTIGRNQTTLVEENAACVAEMKKNIATLGRDAQPVLASSEDALEFIDRGATVIVDPPRAGLHKAVIDRLLNEKPETIIYLSCNPATQARDAALLTESGMYTICYAKTYNFFPRTPHIEHLVILINTN